MSSFSGPHDRLIVPFTLFVKARRKWWQRTAVADCVVEQAMVGYRTAVGAPAGATITLLTINGKSQLRGRPLRAELLGTAQLPFACAVPFAFAHGDRVRLEFSFPSIWCRRVAVLAFIGQMLI